MANFHGGYCSVPNGEYLPSDFGLDWPEVKRIYVGYCGPELTGIVAKLLRFKPEWRLIDKKRSTKIIAHAHDDSICVGDGRYVLAGESTPDWALWHEYAHVRVGLEDGHGDKWKAEMRKMGQIDTMQLWYEYTGSLPLWTR